MRRSLIAATALACAAPALTWWTNPGAATAADGCDPQTAPVYAGTVPTPHDVLGFDLGDKEVTTAQANRYLQAVDAASADVTTKVMAHTAQGRTIRYAVVGDPAAVRRATRAARLIRSGTVTPEQASALAATSPAISWVAANVHGNEPSGTDASLGLLRDLADRTDCAATAIRDTQVVVVVPVQNPDGRALGYRRNSYGFDMNRDWFARTQTETDRKVELLRKYPAVLFIDAHEMGSDGYFFPPNADPVHHEIADRSMHWINDVYGASMQDAFTAQSVPYFNYDYYDMFYMGYGDTVPTTGFLGAGMTFEKDGYDPLPERVSDHSLAIWTSLSALAARKDEVLRGWAASYRQAVAEGRRGRLEPNKVWAPGSTLERQVPHERVRSYFVIPTPGKRDAVTALVRRLQRMDVEVRRLTAGLRVPDFRGYGEPRRSRWVPAGSYWIPMAQPQKHWIQAMMGEDSYTPFPYFYDTTAWSQPLLFDVEAGRSGRVVHPRSVRVPLLAQPSALGAGSGRGGRLGSVGIWLLDPDSSSAYESEGWMRWLFDKQWRVPYRSVTSDRIGNHALRGLDVLIAPNGYAPDAFKLLGRDGRKKLKHWVRDGGRLVTMEGATEVAARMGLTTARLASPTSDVPGSLVRAVVDPGPLRAGVSRRVYSFYDYENVMTFADPRVAVVSYPSARSRDWFISGYERGARELAGTAVMGAERVGRGQVVTFAGEPNFRAFTTGTQRLLWNALTSARLGVRPHVDHRSLRTSAADARRLLPSAGQLIVTVRDTALPDVLGVLSDAGLTAHTEELGGGLARVVAPLGDAEDSPATGPVVSGLKDLGDDVVAVRLP